MEYTIKPKQKLSLSTTYKKLHNTLWQQKQRNCFLQKQNTILNTKINTIENSKQIKAVNYENLYIEERQKLKELYEKINGQNQFIKGSQLMMEEKNYLAEYSKKCRIETKLNKTNKKGKDLKKKLDILRRKIEKQEKCIKSHHKRLIGNQYQQDEQQNQFIQEGQGQEAEAFEEDDVAFQEDDVLSELQKQNQELKLLCKFKQNQIRRQEHSVKVLNSEIIDLLALKNWLRKYAVKIGKHSTHCEESSSLINSEKQTDQNKSIDRISNSSKSTVIKRNRKTKAEQISVFRKQPKLKLTTY